MEKQEMPPFFWVVVLLCALLLVQEWSKREELKSAEWALSGKKMDLEVERGHREVCRRDLETAKRELASTKRELLHAQKEATHQEVPLLKKRSVASYLCSGLSGGYKPLMTGVWLDSCTQGHTAIRCSPWCVVEYQDYPSTRASPKVEAFTLGPNTTYRVLVPSAEAARQ